MEVATTAYPIALRVALFLVFALSSLLVVIAILSAKSLGGRLGMGLKKIAGGSILYAALFVLTILIDRGWGIVLNPEHFRLFFMGIALFASFLLILGFYQIYKISRELKLFY